MFQRKSLLGLFDHEYIGTMILWYVSSCVLVDKAFPRQPESSATLLQEPQVSYCELILLLVTFPHMGWEGEEKELPTLWVFFGMILFSSYEILKNPEDKS
jgi:hypothetical protein